MLNKIKRTNKQTNEMKWNQITEMKRNEIEIVHANDPMNDWSFRCGQNGYTTDYAYIHARGTPTHKHWTVDTHIYTLYEWHE